MQGKRVLITGGAGFIGSTLVRELLKDGAEVIVLDNFLSGKIQNLLEVQDSIKIIKGDIRDNGLDKVFTDNQVDVVFNLAAEPYIPHCYDRPHQFFDINAGGVLNLMLACKKAEVERVLQYSTSEVYGSAKYVPMDEHHPTLPLSTYAVSKLTADRLCFTLHHEQNIPVIIMRQFNVYGPRETQPYVIPEIISQLNAGNKLNLGNLLARRDFTFVTDAAKAAIKLMGCDNAIGHVVNVGSGTDYSIEQIAYLIADLMEVNDVTINVKSNRLRPLDVHHLNCNNNRIKRLTGWEPEICFREGLKLTIEHFKNEGGRWPWEETFGTTEEVWLRNKSQTK